MHEGMLFCATLYLNTPKHLISVGLWKIAWSRTYFLWKPVKGNFSFHQGNFCIHNLSTHWWFLSTNYSFRKHSSHFHPINISGTWTSLPVYYSPIVNVGHAIKHPKERISKHLAHFSIQFCEFTINLNLHKE